MKTVKICLITLMFLLCIKGTHAQITPLLIDSTQWVYKGFYHNVSDSIFIYRVKGDTIINNITYSKVYQSTDNDTNYYSNNEKLHSFVRNDTNRRAYIRYPSSYCNDTNEILLYDYGLALGDTFNIHLLQPQQGLPCLDTSFRFIVTNRGDNVPMVGDYTGTQLQLALLNYPQYYFCWGDGCPNQVDKYVIWNEGSGALDQTVFYNEYQYCSCCTPYLTSWFTLLCFWEKGNWIKGPCFFYGIDENEKSKLEISIFPNPIVDIGTITIINNKNRIKDFVIYNLLGEIVRKINIDNISPEISITINRRDYTPGCYIGKFTDDEGNTGSTKIIIL